MKFFYDTIWYVSACVRVYACVCASERARARVRGVCVRACVRACVHACVRVRVPVCVRAVWRACGCLRVRARMCANACVRVYVCACACAYVLTRARAVRVGGGRIVEHNLTSGGYPAGQLANSPPPPPPPTPPPIFSFLKTEEHVRKVGYDRSTNLLSTFCL